MTTSYRIKFVSNDCVEKFCDLEELFCGDMGFGWVPGFILRCFCGRRRPRKLQNPQGLGAEASSVAGELESEITELSPVGSPVKCPAPANDGRVVTEANIHFEEKPKNSDSSEGGVRRETNLSDSG